MLKSKVKEREWITEAAILQHLSQPCGDYVVCFDNKFQDGENYYLVMEFLGEYLPLSEYLNRRMDAREVSINPYAHAHTHTPTRVVVRKPGPYANPPTAKETMIFCGLIAGLRQIHSLNVAHRDLKGENILINPKTLCVKYIDFGLSCWHKSLSEQLQLQLPLSSGEGKGEAKRASIGSGTDDSNEGECSGEVGSALFEAPEVLLRDPPFDIQPGKLPEFADLVAADLWSLGMLMYEFLSGNVYYEDYYEFTHSNDEDHTELKPLKVPGAFTPDAFNALGAFDFVSSRRPNSQNFGSTSRTPSTASTASAVDENVSNTRPDQEDDPIFILAYQLLNSMMNNYGDESLSYARDFLSKSVIERLNIISAINGSGLEDPKYAAAEAERFLPLIDATLDLLQKSPGKRVLARLNCTEHTCGPHHAR